AQCAVAGNRVVGDGAPVARGGSGFDPGRQLLDDVVAHPVVPGPRLAGGVDVEARPLAEVVALVVGDVVATRAGVRRHQDDPVLGGVALRAGLGDEVLFVAGEPAQPVQHRALALFGLRREVHAHGHVAAEDLGAVPVDGLPAPEAGVAFDALGHAGLLSSG